MTTGEGPRRDDAARPGRGRGATGILPDAYAAHLLASLFMGEPLNGARPERLSPPWRAIVRAVAQVEGNEARGAAFAAALAAMELTDTEAGTIWQAIFSASPLGSTPPPRPLPSVTARGLMETQYLPQRSIVAGLVNEGSGLLVSPPKSGKSALMRDICLSVATGARALDAFITTQSEALYLCLEDGERRLQRHLRLQLEGEAAPATLHIAFEAPRIGEGLLEALDRYLDDHPATGLVAIDTLAAIRSPRGANTDLFMADYHDLAPLTAMAQARRIGIVIAAHSNKRENSDELDDAAGTHGLTGAVDSVMVLRRTRHEGGATLSLMGRDLDQERKLALKWVPATKTYTFAGDAGEVAATAARQEVQALIERLGDPLNAAEIAAGTGRTANATRQILFQMTQAGNLHRVGRGRYATPAMAASLKQTTNRNVTQAAATNGANKPAAGTNDGGSGANNQANEPNNGDVSPDVPIVSEPAADGSPEEGPVSDPDPSHQRDISNVSAPNGGAASTVMILPTPCPSCGHRAARREAWAWCCSHCGVDVQL